MFLMRCRNMQGISGDEKPSKAQFSPGGGRSFIKKLPENLVKNTPTIGMIFLIELAPINAVRSLDHHTPSSKNIPPKP
jgi:hypothetical protein